MRLFKAKYIKIILGIGFITMVRTFISRNQENVPNYPRNVSHSSRIQIQAKTEVKRDGHVVWYCGRDWLDIGLKDYHDYKQMARDKNRTGPGEQGTEVIPQKERPKRTPGLNTEISDKISIYRAVKDIRHPLCRDKRYLSVLPTVSVVIPLCEEHWNTLLRTVHSVLNRSPPNVLKEIILVDDFSEKKYLKKPLDDHVADNYGGRVRLLHTERREGLIRARLLGARHATGQVLVFLDSHVEANYNWLPPLIEPIARDYRTVTCPFIDLIHKEHFTYEAQDEGARGAFNWYFDYKRLPKLKEDKDRPAEPFESPVMAGGLFAISTKWFWELGGYDPGLEVWGGEQYELSFKLWQCGGQMLDIPCSRVGHIYGASKRNDKRFDLQKNNKRVAEVWMDEYKEYLYLRSPRSRDLDPGNITEQKAIREKLKCKPFKWFIEEVAFDLPKRYPLLIPPSFAQGQVRNVFHDTSCVTFLGDNAVLKTCKSKPEGNQALEMSSLSEVKEYLTDRCMDVSDRHTRGDVEIYQCHGDRGNQFFKYSLDNHRFYHRGSDMCLDCDEDKNLFMDNCDSTRLNQQWTWTNAAFKRNQ